jgi:predicted dehydrogenase
MIHIGILGIGFMGVTHFKAMRQVKGGKVVAICTRDPKKLEGDWRGVQGNFGGSGGVQDLTGIRKYADMRDLFDDPGIDLVDICLPTPLHKQATLAAFKAGKHVLLEKPIEVSLAAADQMLAAAKKARRQFMVAQVLRFFPEFRYLKSALDTGTYGRLKALQLKRIISTPDWGSWNEDLDRTGGPAIDLHIHDSDFGNFLFGKPRAVSSTGVIESKSGQTIYVATNYDFGRRDLAVSAYSGAVATKGLPFEHGYDAYFEKATIAYNSTHCPKVTVVDAKGKKFHPKLSFPEAFAAEMQEAVNTIASGKPSKLISAVSARDSLAICLAEVRSVRSGKPERVRAATS